MWTKKNALSCKKVNTKKLSQYGFTCDGDLYTFEKSIMQGAITLQARVRDNDLHIKVIDSLLFEEYTLAYVESSQGNFVGEVKYMCEILFDDIADKCFDENIFKFEQTKALLAYVKEKYGVEEEYLWESTPNNAIFREKRSGKWFGAVLTVEYKKLGIDKDGLCEIVNLTSTKENVAALLERGTVLAAFHMNKKSWFSVLLDGTNERNVIFELVDGSYNIIRQKHSR